MRMMNEGEGDILQNGDSENRNMQSEEKKK